MTNRRVAFDPALVHDWLRQTAHRHPHKTALVAGGSEWSYAALEERVEALALTLRGMGLKHQDRVVILLDNSAEAVIALYAVMKAGGVFVLLSGAMKGGKLSYICRDAGARILITHPRKKAVVKDALATLGDGPAVLWLGPVPGGPEDGATASVAWDPASGREGALTTAHDTGSEACRLLDIDLAALVYTSGTTGKPKGVMCSHRNMVSVAKSVIQYLDHQPKDRILNVLPLSFGYGLYQVIMSIMVGGTVILEKSFLYPSRILERIGEYEVTGFPIVPTMAAMWLRMEDLSIYRFDSLRYLTCAGAALPVDHLHRLQALLPKASIIPMYGLTECKRVCYLRPEDQKQRPDSVGKAIPNCDVSIVDERDQVVKPNQVGELVVRGANVMLGYWGDAELTAKVFRVSTPPTGRSLYTGDYFRMDEEGYLYYVGRKDDMINCKGERVSPLEIENCICGLPAVAEAAVVGVPDAILGQAIKAFVVVREGNSLTENEVLRVCTQTLEPFMIPKYIVMVENLPRTENGKVNKRLLRDSEVLVS